MTTAQKILTEPGDAVIRHPHDASFGYLCMLNPGDSIVPEAAVNITGSDPHGATRVSVFASCQYIKLIDLRKIHGKCSAINAYTLQIKTHYICCK